MQKVIQKFEQDWELHLNDLKELIKIPSISFEGFDKKSVLDCGHKVADLLKARGLENVKFLEIPNANPFVYGDWLHAKGKPTVLMYAHYDVQPIGQKNLWNTEPFEPTLLKGPGGERLYARGAADDKAGIIAQTAAIHSYLESLGELPVNIKIIVEGEEEIGSPNLDRFLQQYKDLFAADVILLSDTSNFDVGIPALTVSLRGLLGFEIEVRSLKNTVHSGMWGGPTPDPAMALSKLLSTLINKDGRVAVKEINKLVPKLTSAEKKFLRETPYHEKVFRHQLGIVKKAKLFFKKHEIWESLWRKPSISINAMQVASRSQAGNVINDTAWARVTLRLAPGMPVAKSREALVRHFKKNAQWGLDVKISWEEGNSGWAADPKIYETKAFKAAEKALTLGYGKKPVKMGCGGSIPFVKQFVQLLKGAPALLVGVEDPYTNAHGENESLCVSDFKKSCLSQIFLLHELSK
ncbi:MAG: M20/M25/M40 family metallo-hydrolase [Pseudomonadota bacterium]|nr:M20/M25/M40 family metallo-hydrolase [Pseudomonadota bacterium]